MKQLLSNRMITWGFKIVLTLLFLFIVNKSITSEELFVIARYITVYHIAFALILGLLGLFFQVKRWEIILKYQKFSVDNNLAWKTLLWGNLLAFITPGRFGELFRGIQISRQRRGDSLFAVIIDKLFIVTTVLFCGLLCIVLQKWLFAVGIDDKMKIFIFAACVVCVIALLLLTTGKVFNKKHAVPRYFNRVLESLPRLFTPAGKRALVYSCIAHLCLIFQTVVLLQMFGCGSVVANSIAIGQAYGLMPFLSFTIGNMGIREFSFKLFLVHLGVTCNSGNLTIGGAALGTSIIILIMNLVVPAFIGLVWYICDNSTRNDT